MINTAAWANGEWLNNLIMHGYLKRRSAGEGGGSSEEPVMKPHRDVLAHQAEPAR